MMGGLNNNKFYYNNHVLNQKPRSSDRIRFEELNTKINMLILKDTEKQKFKNSENKKLIMLLISE